MAKRATKRANAHERRGTAYRASPTSRSASKQERASQPHPTSPLAKPASGIYKRNLPHIQSEGNTLFVTFRTWEYWILPESVRGIVYEHCLHDHRVKLCMHGFVVMPDHVHLVLTPLQDRLGNTFGLAEIMEGIKGASSHSVNRALGRRGHV